jgi:REase_DpnII-MboI
VATQGSFRRWRWEEKATRQRGMPARWLIDKEADIQAFLLAVLYPYFGNQLQDEQYLQGFGLRQGRFDFAITNLGLIVEVKVIRTSSHVNDLEAQIADDLSLYFKEGNPFKSMVVYIYDDRDKPEPEKYPAIRDALKRRSDRIVDVVIVQRPIMIPDRSRRR